MSTRYPSIIYVKPAIPSRRVRQRRGSANAARVRHHSMAMAADLERAILAESADWEAKIRADEREQVALDTAAGIVDPGLRAVIVDEALADERAKALVRHLAKMEEFDEALDAARAEVRERIAEAVRGTEFWDALATEIRRVDGNHTLGAAAMAEELVPFIAATIARGDT